LTNEEAKIRSWGIIDSSREDLVSFLGEYIRHRSINPEREIVSVERGETTACQRWLLDSLKSLGSFNTVVSGQVKTGEINVITQLAATERDEYRSILFNGHSDVVPVTASEYESWRGSDPWSGKVFGGAVYGRGACDMKGGNASVIWAAHCLSKAGYVPKG
jgi:formylaminopyrimidine deformylase